MIDWLSAIHFDLLALIIRMSLTLSDPYHFYFIRFFLTVEFVTEEWGKIFLPFSITLLIVWNGKRFKNLFITDEKKYRFFYPH